MAQGSLIRLMSKMIIEPTIIVSKDIRNLKEIEDIIEANIEIFTSYYTQAFHVISSVHGLDPAVTFDVLSSKFNAVGLNIATESATQHTDKMMLGEAKFLPISQATVEYLSMEGGDSTSSSQDDDVATMQQKLVTAVAEYQKKSAILEERTKDLEKQIRETGRAEGKASQKYKDLMDIADRMEIEKKNLAKERADIDVKEMELKKARSNSRISKTEVAKPQDRMYQGIVQKDIEITVKITNKNGDQRDVVIPVFIKANLIYTQFDNVMNMLNVSNPDKSFVNRLDAYRAGAISLMDLVFAGDLVREYKERKISDADDLIKFMNQRNAKSVKETIMHGKPGFSTYYSMLVITKREASIIEQRVGGKINKPRYKEEVLERAGAMMLNVIDEDYERVSIYTKDLSGSTDVTFKQLSKRGKDSGGDKYFEIFKDMVVGRAPTL